MSNILSVSNVQENGISMQTLLNSDFEKIGDYLVDFLVTIVMSSLTIVFYILALLELNPLLTVIIASTIPFLVLANIKLGNYVERAYLDIQTSLDKMTKDVNQIHKGFYLILAFNASKHVMKTFVKHNVQLKKSNIKYVAANSFLANSISLISVIVPFLILLLGTYFVVKDGMSVGTLMAIFSFSSTIFMPISGLLGLIPLYKELEVSIDRVNTFVNDDIRVANNSEGRDISENKSHLKVVLSNLSIGHFNKIIHKDINCVITGGLTFIRGENGSGKSTLAQTITGILPILEGEVSKSKNFCIEYVPNTSFLFAGTVMENLVIGLDQYDNDKLLELSELVELDISKDCYVDEVPALSTGQIQKIKIIRALMNERAIIIFDEVISNLSSKIQKKLYDYLKLQDNRIILVIDHNSPRLKSDKSINLTS